MCLSLSLSLSFSQQSLAGESRQSLSNPSVSLSSVSRHSSTLLLTRGTGPFEERLRLALRPRCILSVQRLDPVIGIPWNFERGRDFCRGFGPTRAPTIRTCPVAVLRALSRSPNRRLETFRDSRCFFLSFKKRPTRIDTVRYAGRSTSSPDRRAAAAWSTARTRTRSAGAAGCTVFPTDLAGVRYAQSVSRKRCFWGMRKMGGFGPFFRFSQERDEKGRNLSFQ